VRSIESKLRAEPRECGFAVPLKHETNGLARAAEITSQKNSQCRTGDDEAVPRGFRAEGVGPVSFAFGKELLRPRKADRVSVNRDYPNDYPLIVKTYCLQWVQSARFRLDSTSDDTGQGTEHRALGGRIRDIV